MTELTKFQKIQLYRGATSEVSFDFTNFVFEPGSYCLLTMKNDYDDKAIFTYKFDEAKEYNVVFKDEFTATLTDNSYIYDIMYMINDERYPQCKPSEVVVSEVVGKYESDNQSI